MFVWLLSVVYCVLVLCFLTLLSVASEGLICTLTLHLLLGNSVVCPPGVSYCLAQLVRPA